MSWKWKSRHIQRLKGRPLTKLLLCYHEPNPLKFHIKGVTTPCGTCQALLESFTGGKSDALYTHFQSHKLQISSRVLEENVQWSRLKEWGAARPTRWHNSSQLPGSLTASAARCLIHLTCLLYTALQRSEFNTMANTLHYYQLQHARTDMFLYPRASENFSDVSQKRANENSSSIRTMKTRRQIREAPDRALANGLRAPPRVMLESWEVKTLRIACAASHTAIAESIEIQR